MRLYSLPVLLGILGGIGLLIGPAGLFMLSRKRDPILVDTARKGMDTAFIAMLFLTSLTGFLLMVLRDTGAMGMLLADPSRRRARTVPEPALRQIRARALSLPGAGQIRQRAPAGEVCGVGKLSLSASW